MDINEFLDYCYDPGMLDIEIWDTETQETCYTGPADEIPDELLYAEISTWDVPSTPGCITVNI